MTPPPLGVKNVKIQKNSAKNSDDLQGALKNVEKFNFSAYFGHLACLAAALGPLAWLT